MILKRSKILFVALFATASALYAQVILTADGKTAPYTRIESVLGAPAETPDCSHPAFGPHITQTMDSELGRYVFVFNIHVHPDNDRCKNSDRQRVEIKTEGSSPDYVKGFLNDSVTFRWRFQLPQGFHASREFTHIHQIKAFDGDDSLPLIALTPLSGSPDKLQLLHINSADVPEVLARANLTPFIGEWVEAYEKITYNTHGTYSIVIRRLKDGKPLFAYQNKDIDLWRKNTTVMRPKWGIYRSLKKQEELRDEQVRFDRFCLAKGKDDCPGEQTPSNAKSTATTPTP